MILEDHVYPENIDPASGAVLPNGEEGELVFTLLAKEALPVIRYRTRDLTRLLPPTARSMRRIGKIAGRSDDMLMIRGVNVFPTQIEELLLRCPELSPHYLIEVAREGNLDRMRVHAELDVSAAHLGADGRQAVSRVLQHLVKTCVGISIRVQIHKPGGLERSTGRARRVIDRRPKDGGPANPPSSA